MWVLGVPSVSHGIKRLSGNPAERGPIIRFAGRPQSGMWALRSERDVPVSQNRVNMVSTSEIRVLTSEITVLISEITVRASPIANQRRRWNMRKISLVQALEAHQCVPGRGPGCSEYSECKVEVPSAPSPPRFCALRRASRRRAAWAWAWKPSSPTTALPSALLPSGARCEYLGYPRS